MAVFGAYYDASGDDATEGHTVVVGLVATEAKWKKFEGLWNACLADYGLSHHHHKDYVHSRHEYTTWEGDEPRREAYLARMIKCLKRGINKGYIAGVANASIKAVNAKYVFGKGDGSGAYMVTADACRKWIEHFIQQKHRGSELHHVFEKGDAGQGWLRLLLTLGGRNAGWSILPKKDNAGRWLRQFEGADLVAWEIRRIMEDAKTRKHRHVRVAVRELSRMLPLAGAEITAKRLLEICDNAPPGTFERRA